MVLVSCKICGRAFGSVGTGGKRGICNRCLNYLENVYSRAHEYLRDHYDQKFDVAGTADAIGVEAQDIQILVELGYFERDIQTYGNKNYSQRQNLAKAFENELGKMQKKSITTYGGRLYERKNSEGMNSFMKSRYII